MTMSRSTDAQSPDFDEATMRAALELALRAPSLHNSQPWRWRLDGTTAYLYLDSTRRLLASSVLSQPLEVGDTRAFLYKHVVRAQPWHPQLLLRLGWLPAGTHRCH